MKNAGITTYKVQLYLIGIVSCCSIFLILHKARVSVNIKVILRVQVKFISSRNYIIDVTTDL